MEETLKNNYQDYPLYTIGIVAELLGLHSETIRLWEKSGVVQLPKRRSGKRFYSENDLKRLRFVHKLASEGLTLRAILYYLRLYACWKTLDCSGCLHGSNQTAGSKPCWKVDDSCCQVANLNDPCADCPMRTGLKQLEPEQLNRKLCPNNQPTKEQEPTSIRGNTENNSQL